MVRFWPFGGNDNSPGSFERILVKLASQIQTTSSKLAALRQRSRRYKALFTIYSVIGYILFCIITVLVVGHRNIGLQESGGLIGGPVGIYLVRKLLDLYYGRRIAFTESKLEELQMEQRTTIEKLKAATKYSTTQSLIEKYGDTATRVAVTPKQENKKAPSTGPIPKTPLPQPHQPSQQQQIPPLPPILTPDQIRVQQQLLAQQKAGIPPQYGQGQPGNAQPRPPTSPQIQPNPPQTLHMQGQTQPPSQQHLQPEEATAPKWYDRILDVVLGEDEMSAKNRFALICKNCRMVNGLAPPGTRSLDGMDQWGCARCGTMNGGRKNPVLVPEDGPKTESETEFAPEDPEPKHPVARMTRSKTKREDSVATDDNGGEIVKQENEEEDEPEVLKPKSKTKVRGRKKA